MLRRASSGLAAQVRRSLPLRPAAFVTRTPRTLPLRSLVTVRNLPLPGSRGLKLGSCLQRHAFHLSRPALGVVPFNLADIGEGIAEVEIMQWYVKEGDEVSEFDEICEVQSDKATVSITSRYAGKILKVHYDVGDLAQVGKPLVDIDVEGVEVSADAAAPEPVVEDNQSSAASDPTPEPEVASSKGSDTPARTPAKISVAAPESNRRTKMAGGGKVLATPAVRRLATEHNIDLSTVPASGKQGQVTKPDLLRFISSQESNAQQAHGGVAGSVVAAGAGVEAASGDMIPPARPLPVFQTPEDRTEPIRGIQRMMVNSMKASLQVQHFGYYDEVEMDALIQVREELKGQAAAQGVRMSFMPLMIKAASLALLEYPVLNASVADDESSMTYHGAHHIAIAMDTPRGLLVPNVRHCEQRSIMDIAHELNRLQALGAANKLGQEELSGGTFTLSNIGAIGGTYAAPVILTPQVAIGALGKMQKLPRFDDEGNVTAKTLMKVSWSADHRIIDGATMARFSNLWKDYLESPVRMLTELK